MTQFFENIQDKTGREMFTPAFDSSSVDSGYAEIIIPVITYTISFNMQGHGTAISPITGVTTLNYVDFPTQADDGTFNLHGWSLEPNGTELTSNFTPTANTTFYAKWVDTYVASDILSTRIEDGEIKIIIGGPYKITGGDLLPVGEYILAVNSSETKLNAVNIHTCDVTELLGATENLVVFKYSLFTGNKVGYSIYDNKLWITNALVSNDYPVIRSYTEPHLGGLTYDKKLNEIALEGWGGLGTSTNSTYWDEPKSGNSDYFYLPNIPTTSQGITLTLRHSDGSNYSMEHVVLNGTTIRILPHTYDWDFIEHIVNAPSSYSGHVFTDKVRYGSSGFYNMREYEVGASTITSKILAYGYAGMIPNSVSGFDYPSVLNKDYIIFHGDRIYQPSTKKRIVYSTGSTTWGYRDEDFTKTADFYSNYAIDNTGELWMYSKRDGSTSGLFAVSDYDFIDKTNTKHPTLVDYAWLDASNKPFNEQILGKTESGQQLCYVVGVGTGEGGPGTGLSMDIFFVI